MAQTTVVEFGTGSMEASGDVAQAFAVSELCKRYGQ